MSLEHVALKYRFPDKQLTVVLEDYKKSINRVIDFLNGDYEPDVVDAKEELYAKQTNCFWKAYSSGIRYPYGTAQVDYKINIASSGHDPTLLVESTATGYEPMITLTNYGLGSWTIGMEPSVLSRLDFAYGTDLSDVYMAFDSSEEPKTIFFYNKIASLEIIAVLKAEGTAPFVVSSTTVCTNLNADLLDGNHASAFLTSVTAHNLLSATHGDTTTGTVLRGDIITGQGTTPKWVRLAKGTTGYFLKADANDAVWAAHGLSYGDVGAAAVSHAHAAGDITSGTLLHERGGLEADVSAYSGLVKISAGATSSITDSSTNWNTAYGWGNHALAGYLTSVTAHDILSATHGDTLASAVSRGSIIIGNSTPKWAELTVGTVNQFVGTDGTDVAWETIDHGIITGLGDDDHTQYLLAAGTRIATTLGVGTALPTHATLEITSAGATTEYPVLAVGGGCGYGFWKDTTPTKAWFIGHAATPGGALSDHLQVSHYDGSSWTNYARFSSDGAFIAARGVARFSFQHEDSTTGATFQAYKKRLTTPFTVQKDDCIGAYFFYGWDSAAYQNACKIAAFVDDTPGAGDMPGRIAMFTCANGSVTLVEHFRLDNAGNVRLGPTTGSIVEKLNVEGRISLVETTAPTLTASYGKIYVKSSDSLLYFMDDGGTEYPLTTGSEGLAPSSQFFRGSNTKRCCGFVVYGNGADVWNTIGTLSGSASYVGDDTGPYRRHTCGTTTRGGYYSNTYTECRRNQNPTYWSRIMTDAAIANIIIWAGITDVSPTNNADDPSGAANYAMFCYSTTLANPNWYIVSKDGATQSATDTGVAVAVATIYDFKIKITSGGSIQWSVKPYGSAATTGTKVSNPPPTSTDMGWANVGYSKSGSTYFKTQYMYMEMDIP